MNALSVKGFALACGVTWAIGALFMGWVAALGWGNSFVEVLGSYYIGYQSGFIGGIIGGVWAFVDGVITGLIFSLFYNLFSGQKENQS